ncbi:GDP-mannose 4,6-dehydratase [Candidatus Gottesmanbacteria bacterium RIFCSPLOWO2_01_FULL_48_11]|uniref:NAD-dependent epimerase/dehydratase n=2 Tax=Microgenomates group TaxID=1794810 RepID=A0A0G1F5L6_9BACT|nr:MAG: NAD-dependent epimerase/dehydratase [Candidatus Woesebacteria bacterium GW2011_GWA1_43_12]OGG27740.1 MAG: GDP-mannose 4,6-dehydratase [Candidatus Gottesmanbacteria bacterium RIFCSPLOWO2_01_FULL_48_11]
MKKVLITGIAGFAGSHLAELLLSKGFEVHGMRRPRTKMDHIESIANRLHLTDADLLDSHSLYSTISRIKPDYIFHLAAQSFVPTSWVSPSVTLEVNIVGSANLFEAVRQANIDPVIQIACSSEEYGMVHDNEVPIKETNPLRPLSPYAVSKVAMDYLGYQYHQSYGVRVVRTRGFNHTGPRRGDTFAESNFAKQIALIEKGKQEPVVHVGNVDAKRDYTDVRDMVKGYLLAVEKCDPGDVYNICTGSTVKIADVLKLLLSYSKIKVEIKEDPDRMRPSDVPILLGDNSKFVAKTGWKPEIVFEKTMEDLLNYWRERV